jgi:hypothetical protein
MQVRRFELELDPPAEDTHAPPLETAAPASVRAAAPEDLDQRSEESTEEPGYGHGV